MKTQKQRHFTPVTTVKSIIGNSTKNYQWMLSPLGELSGNSSIFLQFHSVESKSESPLSCVQLCDPMDCSPPGESTGFSRPEYWMWVPYPFSRGSSWPRDRTQVSHTVGRFFTTWVTKEDYHSVEYLLILTGGWINLLTITLTKWSKLLSLVITLATWCKELTHWKTLWRWERLKAKGEEDGRGRDG